MIDYIASKTLHLIRRRAPEGIKPYTFRCNMEKAYLCGNMRGGVWTSAYDKDSIPCPQIA